MKGTLIHFNKAKAELALARDIDEIKDIRDKAEALRLYSKQAGDSLEMQNACAEIKLRAERRAGELLREQEKHKGGRPTTKNPSDESRGFKEEPIKLEEVGISYDQSSEWQKLASLPDEVFDNYIEEKKENKDEVTTAGALRLAKEINQENKKKEKISKPWPDEDKKLKADLEAGKTVVVNLQRHHHLISWASKKDLLIKVDRTTEWGNPFRLGEDGTRDDVIEKYDKYYFPHKNTLNEKIGELKGCALACHCSPEKCHADILKRIANRKK